LTITEDKIIPKTPKL